MKNQNTERQKPKRIDKKYRIIETRTEQNNDHTRIMHKMEFCSFFKAFIKPFEAT